MADAMFMYAVVAGIFALLVGVTFGARGARYRSGRQEDKTTTSAKHEGGK
jgi:hypothetical protein